MEIASNCQGHIQPVKMSNSLKQFRESQHFPQMEKVKFHKL